MKKILIIDDEISSENRVVEYLKDNGYEVISAENNRDGTEANQTYQEHLEQLVRERTRELEQTNSQLENINRRLREIVETTSGLAGCMEMRHFSTQILDEFSRHMVASGGSLYFVEKNGLRRMYSLDPGHAPDFLEFPLPEKSIIRKVLETGSPLLIENLEETSQVAPSGWGGYSDGSLLAFPIPDSTGKISGIITLHSKKNPPFVEQDKEMGAILASYSCETLRAVTTFQALQQSEKKYRTLFEKTSDAIFVIDRESGKYLDANGSAEALTGKSFQELKAHTIHDVLPEFPGYDTDQKKELGIVTFKREGSSDRIARLSILPLDETSIIAIARDITQDLEIEKQLRQSQKMEAIGTLAGGIAHDFNNILGGILGYAQIALLDMESPEKVKNNIDQIINGARRAGGLVQQILTFSRQSDYQKEPIKLHTIVREAVKFLRSSIPSTIQIEEKIYSDSVVLADATQAHQIVLNLCTNAYHAMRDTGGTLKVELAEIEIQPGDNPLSSVNFPGKYAKLEITDTGHGMDKETLDKIFNPYFTTKQPDKGTGLGLAVVDGIIKEHNGFIKVSSRAGEGSKFQVFFPVVEEAGSVNGKDENTAALPQGSGRILLIDDEEGILDTTQDILERIGYEVTSFNNAHVALNTFSKNPAHYDLVITDIAMPGMTGDKLAIELLRIRPGIPVLLCTGFSEAITEAKSLSLGISGLLYKPIVMGDLAEKIQELLGKRKH